MILFAFPAYAAIGGKLAPSLGIPLGQVSLDCFPNHEIPAIQTEVASEKLFILGTIAPPDEQLLIALQLSHTLKKEGARTVTALLPYFAYARDDYRCLAGKKMMNYANTASRTGRTDTRRFHQAGRIVSDS